MPTGNIWLVQRMKWNNLQMKPGMKFSELFNLDYIGSAEFEFGAIPHTRRLWTHFDFKIDKCKSKSGEKCWIASSTISVSNAVELFEDQLNGSAIKLKERTYIKESYSGESDIDSWFCVVDSNSCYSKCRCLETNNAYLLFAIFKKKEAAEQFLKIFPMSYR